MVQVVYHFRKDGRTEVLPADSIKQGRRLFRYAVACATADLRIELVVNGQIVRTHWVDYEETIPTVTEVVAASPRA